jgi:hypothetical protein
MALELLDRNMARIPVFHRRRREWGRGGFPASSIPEAISHGAEPPLPMMDAVDRRLDRDTKRLRSLIVEAADLANELDRLLNFWLIAAPAIPDPDPCRNCNELMPFGERRRTCAKCRMHRSRYGLDWPNKPAV